MRRASARMIERRCAKRLMIAGVEFAYLYLFGIGLAALGWIAENAVKLFSQGIIDCRFHMLPFISPYALIPFAYQILFGDPDDVAFFGCRLFKARGLKSKVLSNIICLSFTCSGVFAGELVVGNIWELLFGVKLWDYSSLPLQVTQYAGLIPSLGYGGGAYLIFKLGYKPLLALIRGKVSYSTAKAVCCTLGVLIVFDTAAMVAQIILFRQSPMYWQLKIF